METEFDKQKMNSGNKKNEGLGTKEDNKSIVFDVYKDIKIILKEKEVGTGKNKKGGKGMFTRTRITLNC